MKYKVSTYYDREFIMDQEQFNRLLPILESTEPLPMFLSINNVLVNTKSIKMIEVVQ